MSQDQKPGRVRMLAGSGADAGKAAGGPVDHAASAGKDASSGAAAAKGGKLAGLLPILLFIVGCIGGGVAVARLGPL